MVRASIDHCIPSRAGVKFPDLILVLLVVVLYWCQLFYQLQIEWSANEQYAYGWFVPLLAAGLFYRRWLDRPAPDYRSLITDHSSPPRSLLLAPCSLPWESVGLSAFLLFALLPLRLIHEANVGWRSAQWLHGLVLVSLSLLLLWRIGGSPWVKHFGFPVIFLLVSVPWPSRLEDYIVQGLMRLVAGVTVDVVGLFDIPAMRRGNLLELGSGVVNVDGACSGVRSLQTSLMAALLLGELYRLAPWRRLALIPAGLLVAFLANLSRTSFLTWSAARQGMERMHAWHDPAGVAVVVVVLGSLWLTARLLAPRRPVVRGQKSEVSSQQSTVHSPQSTVHGPLSSALPAPRSPAFSLQPSAFPPGPVVPWSRSPVVP
jgi:exosortase